MSADVEALGALYRQTTQGALVVDTCSNGAPMVRGEENWHFVAECGVPPHGRHEANAAWIAAIHNAWPVLRARVAALEAEREGLRAKLAEARDAIRAVPFTTGATIRAEDALDALLKEA